MSVDLYRRYLSISQGIAEAHGGGDWDRMAELLAERGDLQDEISARTEPLRGDLLEIGEILAETARLEAGILEAMQLRRDTLSRRMQKMAATCSPSEYRAESPVALDRRA